jgi:hypothetical protein
MLMFLFGLLVVGLGILAACYKEERIVPAKETTKVKPIIVAVLVGLGALIMLGSVSEPESKPAPKTTTSLPGINSHWSVKTKN